MACLSASSPCATTAHHRAMTRMQPIPCHRRLQRAVLCRAEPEGSTEVDSRKTLLTSTDEDVMSREEIRKLAELRREQQRGQSQSNIVQGALEEAQLITWPTPKKAFFDTLLVLAIVTASGGLLFGLNVLLAEASEFWYHR